MALVLSLRLLKFHWNGMYRKVWGAKPPQPSPSLRHWSGTSISLPFLWNGKNSFIPDTVPFLSSGSLSLAPVQTPNHPKTPPLLSSLPSSHPGGRHCRKGTHRRAAACLRFFGRCGSEVSLCWHCTPAPPVIDETISFFPPLLVYS
jgi:hypothetical protein